MWKKKAKERKGNNILERELLGLGGVSKNSTLHGVVVRVRLLIAVILSFVEKSANVRRNN